MDTKFGRALVAGQLGRGGYSAQGLARVAERLRAGALGHGFQVVILTPHSRRGRGIAETNAAFLRVVQAWPKFGAREEVGRVRLVRCREVEADPGPVITSALEARCRARGMPELTLRILQEGRPERVAHAEEALALDGVMTASQLARHFGLSPEDLPGRPTISAVVRPVHTRFALEVPVQFLLAARAVGKLDDHALSHRAATGELRQQNGVSPDSHRWEVAPSHRQGLEVPDALWHSPSGLVAVEYDDGDYPLMDVLAKLRTWQNLGYAVVIWGVGSARRQQTLAGKIGLPVQLTQWWQEPGN